jgi:hypothetical protein
LPLVGLATTATGAQPVYRCANAYSHSLCPAATLIDADDARTDAQRADARRLATDEKRLGQQMASERIAAQAELDRSAKPVKT